MTTSPAPSPFTDHKESVRAASTVDIVLNNLPATIDGVAMSYGDRFLAKDQNDPVQNGIYVYLGETGAAEVTTGGRDGQLTSGALVIVEEGTTNGDSIWLLATDDPIEVGETALTFVEVGAEPPLPSANDLSDMNTAGAVSGSILKFNGTEWIVAPGVNFDPDGYMQYDNGVIYVGSYSGGIQQALTVYPDGSTGDTFRLYDDGRMEWGSFTTNGPDVGFSRSAPGILKMDAGDKFQQNAAPTVNDDLTNKLYVDNAVGGASTLLGYASDNTQGPYNLSAPNWTPITTISLQITGNGVDDVEVEFFNPTFQGSPTPAGNINWYAGIVNTEVGPNDTIIQVEFDHANGHALKTGLYIKCIIPAFSGTMTLVPAAVSNTAMTVYSGGTGELAGAATLTAKFLA